MTWSSVASSTARKRRVVSTRHAAARAGQPGQGAPVGARGRAGTDARAASQDRPDREPVGAPGRRDRLHRPLLQRALGHAGGARDRRPRAAAPDVERQAVPGAATIRGWCAPMRRAPGWPATRATASRTWPGWRRELSQVRARGYARDNEELELGVRCIAAGIRDDSGRLVAGLSVSAPADRMQDDWLEDLQATAARISSGARTRARCLSRAAAGAQIGLAAPATLATGLAAGAGCIAAQRLAASQSRMRCGVADARVLADGIEQHHDDTLAFDDRLHHQAATGRGDVAGLLQADVPLRIARSGDWCCRSEPCACRPATPVRR